MRPNPAQGGGPVCLVAQEEDDSLRVCAEGIALLDGLGAAPVAVLAVAGLYRTGKSFLLNQVMTPSSRLVSSHPVSSNRMSSHAVSCRLISSHRMSCRVISCHLIASAS
jgi:hypothetical protein